MKQLKKHVEAYPHNGILNNQEKWTTSKCNDMNESHRHYVHWKKSGTKEQILCNLISVSKNRKNYPVVIDVRIVVNSENCWSPAPAARDSAWRDEWWLREKWDSLSIFYGLPVYSKFKILFYTFTKALGQRFDIFRSPSSRFITSINHCCSFLVRNE